MKDFIKYLVEQIVKNPADVEINETVEEGVTTFVITVNPNDMGIIIGKEGRTIRSIRNLVKAKAIKDDVHVNVTIKDDQL